MWQWPDMEKVTKLPQVTTLALRQSTLLLGVKISAMWEVPLFDDNGAYIGPLPQITGVLSMREGYFRAIQQKWYRTMANESANGWLQCSLILVQPLLRPLTKGKELLRRLLEETPTESSSDKWWWVFRLGYAIRYPGLRMFSRSRYGGPWTISYRSVEEHAEFARATFEEDIAEGMMVKMFLRDFNKLDMGNIGRSAVIVEDEAIGKKRIDTRCYPWGEGQPPDMLSG